MTAELNLTRATRFFRCSLLVCTLSVLGAYSQESRAASRRLSTFSIPQSQAFFNSPQRFNQFNNFNQFSGFNSTGGFNNRFDLLSGNTSFFNNGFLVDPRQATPINNASKIKILNNAVIEVDQFGVGQRLFIDGNGNLIGGAKPPEARTVDQLKEFYLANRDKFRGNQKATVDRFLAKQGALSNGLFKIDLDEFALDWNDTKIKNILNSEKYKGNKAAMRRELGLAALNYLLNTLQLRTKIKIPPESIRPDGTVTLNLQPFFRGEVLAMFNQSDNTSACTGKIRLNRLINFTLNPDNYFKILNFPKTEQELAQSFGTQYDKTLTKGNKIIIGRNAKGDRESVPTNTNQRVLEVQNALNVPGGTCYRSFDTFDQNAVGESSAAKNIKQEGINFAYDGTEGLCLGGNGFMLGFLANAQGNLLTRAPAGIASGGILGPEIKSVVSCLDCHADGFMGGGISSTTKAPYTDHFDTVPNRPTVFRDTFGNQLNHKDFFTRNSNYFTRVQRDNEIFREARRVTGSEFIGADGKPFATLPNIEKSTNAGIISAANAAVELGMGDTPQAAEQAKRLIGGEFMERQDFEAKYCNLIRGRNDFLNEFQEQGNLRQQQFNNGFPTHINR